MTQKEYKLSIEVVAHIAQCVQLAILTGTEISENFCLIRLQESDMNPNELCLSDSYREQANKNLENLVKKAEELSEVENTDDEVKEKAFGILSLDQLRLRS